MKSSVIAAMGLSLFCATAFAVDSTSSSTTTASPVATSATSTTAGVASSPATATTTSTTPAQAAPAIPATPTSAEQNKMQSEAFLAANKTKQGVVSLPDGLQYKVITEGKGTQPTDADTVTVDYAGTLVNGTEFDSSFKRGQPVTFKLNEVIPGWVEALKLMKAGSTWEVYIPPSLAYGEQGVPPVIGPNQTLIFKITLIDVKKS